MKKFLARLWTDTKSLFVYLFGRTKPRKPQYGFILWPGISHWASVFCGKELYMARHEPGFASDEGRYVFIDRRGKEVAVPVSVLAGMMKNDEYESMKDYLRRALIPIMPKYLRFTNFGFQWDYDQFIPQS